jgi:multidrug efflux pump subunit AcrA (membrane-fusion protein)
LNPSLDTRNRTLTAEARLTKADTRLRPGMFVQVKLVTDRGAKVVTVPRNALYSIAGLTKLFKIENGTARLITFVPGPEIDGFVEVPGDLLQNGDRVATSELPALTNGAKVKQ